MPAPTPNSLNPTILRSIVEHVFMPPRLPDEDPGEQIVQEMNVALCDNLIEAAQDFSKYLLSEKSPLWKRMIKAVELVRGAANVPFGEAYLQGILSDMEIEGLSDISLFALRGFDRLLSDVFAMHVRAQNAGLIVRRPASADFVQFEVFEVSPRNHNVMSTEGKLLCSYPGPAIQVPTDTFMDKSFLLELSSFLVKMDVDSTPTATKAGSVVREFHESADPRYISGLLVGILRGFGQPADVERITKRIGDEVLWCNHYKSLRRSPLWLVLRVALQSSLPAELYKLFILFFHAHLLRKSLCLELPSELLYVMRVKMTRRLSKLGSAVPQDVCEFVHNTAVQTEVLITKRWTTFQEIEPGPTLEPTLDFVADTHLSLERSYNYLTEALNPILHTRSQTSFNPQGSRLYTVRDFSQFSNGKLSEAIANGGHIAVMDFELSVEKNLGSWVAASTDSEGALDVIASCIRQYHAGAEKLYKANPEDSSIMILTIMSLWVALDTLAIKQCPLLKEYSPEIPSKFLHDLLLHRSSTINRALQIEEYLCQRHGEVPDDVPSILSNVVSHSCFAVKHYSTSEDLKRRYEEIEEHAQEQRKKKCEELESLNQRLNSLRSEASKMNHDIFKHRSETCKKCRLDHEADSLKISVHEWPLPSEQLNAQRVVFELSPPHTFSVWRDITYMILRLSPVTNSYGSAQKFLDTFTGLSKWAVPIRGVTIGSNTEPYSDRSHYQAIKIPTDESSVLMKNGLSFQLIDRSCNSWVMGSLSESSIAELCAPPIDTTSPYRYLHRFVSNTQHTANDTIASQAECPKEISLHEFIAFSGLRSGPRLQWLNIARELASSSLSFRHEEVHTLFTQAAWQLGPHVAGVREWHMDLEISSFGNTLLRELESLVERVRANWLEEVTVRTIGM